MKFLLISCVLWTISFAIPPEGFTNLGNYGTAFATRKTYYWSDEEGVNSSNQFRRLWFKTFPNKFQFGIRHSAICGAAGLRTLSLDSAEEFEYFLALMMWTRSHGWVGAVSQLNFYRWLNGNGRVDYPMQWFPDYPVPDANHDCLYMDFDGVGNYHCELDGYWAHYFCQSVGPWS